MSDFFGRLAGRARGTVDTVRPSILPLYASADAGAEASFAVTEASSLASPAAGLNLPWSAPRDAERPASSAAPLRSERGSEHVDSPRPYSWQQPPVDALGEARSPSFGPSLPLPAAGFDQHRQLVPEARAQQVDDAARPPRLEDDPRAPSPSDNRAMIDEAVRSWLGAAGLGSLPRAPTPAVVTRERESARSGSAAALTQSARNVSEPPVVRIHIGRVDLRAATPAPAAARAPSGPARPLVPLDRFLAERFRGDQ